MPLLEVRDLSVRFGGVVALDRVSFSVDAGKVVAIIGPNGAGKTTLFNVITRVYRPSAGAILLDGGPILGLAPHQVIRRGLARTFQNLALFRSMTVLENVLVGYHSRLGTTFLGAAVPMPTALRDENVATAKAMEMLDFVGLAAKARMPVAGLPFGTQKRVELARALASRPRLLLLDEPAGGISHEEVEALMELLRRIRAELDLTMLLVEHHMNMVLRVSDQVRAPAFGKKIADGPP